VKSTLDTLVQETSRLLGSGQANEALNRYALWLQTEQAHPLGHFVWFNYGSLLQSESLTERAMDAYRACLKLVPGFPPALINLGLCFEALKSFEQALSCWGELTQDEIPTHSELREYFLSALNHSARLLEDLDRLDEATQCLERSLEVDHQQTDVVHHWVHVQQKACQWPVYRALQRVRPNQMLLATSPLPMLAISDDPSLLLLNAREFVRRKWGIEGKQVSKGKRVEQRIRIGYVSGDFCTHAVGVLLPEVIQAHDRMGFEVYAYDYSREDGSSLRRQLLACFDQVRSIHGLSDEAAADLIAQDDVDVLIDLQGISFGARPRIAACRPARTQGAWLGFIGTTGMPWIDFVVTDRYALPSELELYFTESPLHVAGSFLPLALKRQNAVAPMSREASGFPNDRLILAALGNVYKITPMMFAAWMRLLQQFPSTLLWLIDDNPTATANLRRAADQHGINPSRLLFTARESYPVYLRRLEHAELFLDSFPYNCGATARDVVSCGVPLVSLSGRSMVSRMGGSILASIGLDELIAHSIQEYESIAVRLLSDPLAREDVRRRLMLAIDRSSIAIEDFVRSLESGYRKFLQESESQRA